MDAREFGRCNKCKLITDWGAMRMSKECLRQSLWLLFWAIKGWWGYQLRKREEQIWGVLEMEKN